MANSKAPKHDFAPAWLKVPDHDSWKPPGSKPSEQPSRPSRPSRREDYYNGYIRQDYCMPLQRQHSFDNYYDDRRYPPQKFRHRSFDDDYYGYGCYGGGYYDGYAYDKFAGPHYRSHPGLYQDSKYSHPNAARYGPPGPQVNGGGAYPPPYYSPYMYDYYQGGPYYGGSFTGNKRRPPIDKSDGRYRNGRERRHSDSRSGGGSKQNSLDDDFPSLNGEVDGEKENSGGNKTGSTLGAWGKSPTGTVNGTSRNARDDRSDDFVHLSSKLLNKSGVRGYKDSFVDKEVPLKFVPSSDARKDINSNSRTGRSTPQTNHLDHNGHGDDPIENGAVESCRDDNGPPDMDERLVCGINDLSMSSVERSLLASSVEAEQRLLREMGWNEADEEEYVITEDDLREFQKLKQMKQQKNGLQCSWTKVWSAQHIGVLPEAPHERVTDSPCSSSDDDSDLN